MRLWAGLGAAVLAAALLGVLAWGLGHPPAAAAALRAGAPAPNLSLELLDGSSTSLAAYRGSPLVVNFWSTWCADCRRERPVLAAAASTHPGARFLGVLYQDTPAAARGYQAGADAYPYPVGYSDGAGTAFGVEADPETFFIDRAGVVKAIALGPLDPSQLGRDLEAIGA